MIVSESTGCCFSEETKLIAPLHPSPFPPTFAEAALHEQKLYGNKCIYISTRLTTAIKILHRTVIPVEPQWIRSDRPWPTSILKQPALLLLSAHTCTFPRLLSLDTPAQQQEIGIRCRGDFVFHYRLPPQSQEEVCLPCGNLAKWENSISVITAHTKHKSLIASTHTAVNIDNNPEFKGLTVRWSSKWFARPEAVPQPRLQLWPRPASASAVEPISGISWNMGSSLCLWGGRVGWIFHCRFLLQHTKLTYAQENIK